MHLKSCSKLIRSELRLDAAAVESSQRSRLCVGQQGALRRSWSSNHGNIGSGRLPFSIISGNVGSTGASTRALQTVPPPPGCQNDVLRLHRTIPEDANAPLDIWTVIRPGHVREKIAIFASEAGRAGGAGRSEHLSTSSRDVCVNHVELSGPPRATKAKGSWEENCSAKRRRRSGKNQDQATRHHDQQTSVDLSGSEVVAAMVVDEDQELKVSVVEMVAFLEQRASKQQQDCKPLLAPQRISTTITLCRAPPPEVRGEEPESIRVMEMVAKLESECLRRKAEGDLSRSNSLRRAVGRVLLTAGDLVSAPSQLTSSVRSSLSLGAAATPRDTPALALATPSSPHPGESQEAQGLEAMARTPISDTAAAPPLPEEAEPVPGLLFLCSRAEPLLHTDSEHHPPRHRSTCDPHPAPPQPRPSDDSGRRRRRRARPGEARRVCASQDFLQLRRRLQQLLAPQPFMAVLPHHLLVKIFLLLPTQSLAALKCTCHYFKFVIENYGVRPADSLWVSDPRYRDDPCKQCKKRYERGDVSLCRWHHKPYCQALPYGPGYWMCCHGPHRDTPGCNMGLHDNRWVPPFHSINMPIYRRSRGDENS